MTVLALLLPFSVSTAAADAGIVFFHSPSGNIGCAMGGGVARCDIKKHDWAPPPKPSDCRLDWGYGLTVGLSGPGRFFCGGDTVFGPGRTLSYGSSLGRGRFICTMSEAGVRCLNRGDGHGFKLSRERAVRF